MAITAAVDLARVYKYIISAIFLLDKTETFFAVEPFYSSVYLSCYYNSFRCEYIS